MARKRLTLAPVELLLMKVVWRLGRASVQEVRDEVARQRDLAYTTVLTMLRTLEEKGFLTHEEEDRRYVYRPLVPEAEVSGHMLRDLLDRVFDGSKELLLTRLLELGELDEKELKRLRDTLVRGEGEQGPEKSATTPFGLPSPRGGPHGGGAEQ